LHAFLDGYGIPHSDRTVYDQFAVRVHSEKNRLPCVLRILSAVAFLLSAYKAKEFIHLGKCAAQAPNWRETRQYKTRAGSFLFLQGRGHG